MASSAHGLPIESGVKMGHRSELPICVTHYTAILVFPAQLAVHEASFNILLEPGKALLRELLRGLAEMSSLSLALL